MSVIGRVVPPIPSSCPALSRASTSSSLAAAKTGMAGSSPAMTRVVFAALARDDRVLRLEERARGILGRAFPGGRLAQPLRFGIEQRDTLVELLERKQRKVLPDLVGDLLARPVVVFDWHLVLPRS